MIMDLANITKLPFLQRFRYFVQDLVKPPKKVPPLVVGSLRPQPRPSLKFGGHRNFFWGFLVLKKIFFLSGPAFTSPHTLLVVGQIVEELFICGFPKWERLTVSPS